MARPLGRPLVVVVSAAGLGLLAAVSASFEAQQAAARAQVWLVPLVGVLLAGAAYAMRGPVTPRVLLALTAGTWLLGSMDPWLLLVHQGVLLVTLLVVPTGRLEGWGRFVAVLAVPIALGMIVQPVVGLVFCAVGTGLVLRRRTPATIGAAVAGALVGATLCGSWLVRAADPARFDPESLLLLYEAAIVAAAGALVLGSRAHALQQQNLVDRLVAGSERTGLAGLAEVLADVLRAPGLAIARPSVAEVSSGEIGVWDADRLVAVVRHPAVEVLDATTRQSVADAVRLVALGEERREALAVQASALEAAQRRMVAAQDEQRTATAARLRDDVVAPLRAAATQLAGTPTPSDPVAADALAVALGQIRSASADVEELVYGAGPAELGEGRLADALATMSARSPVAVDLRVEGPVVGSPEVESALYYVCAEALVNVHRHARTDRASVELTNADDVLRLTVADQGVGGADPGSSGLLGLADRVRMHGGRLRLDSPPGAGTTLTVEMPST